MLPRIRLAGALAAGAVALAAASGCAGLGATTVRDKGLEPALSTREAIEHSLGPRRLALMVGVNRYEDPEFPALRFADKDATDLGAVLRSEKYGGFDRVVVLSTDEETTRARVLKEIAGLKADARREDSVVVYFSGHGTMALGAGGEARLYLAARDTRVSDLARTGIDLQDLQAVLGELAAERKALILDACFSGMGKSRLPVAVAERVQKAGIPVLSRSLTLGQSEAHLFATSWGRPAREDDALQHGVYTYQLIQALNWQQSEADTNGDGLVTIYEAHDFARGETVRRTAAAQVPEAYFRVVGERDLYLVGDVARRAETEMGLIWFYGDSSSEFADASLTIDGRFKGSFPGSFPVPPGEHRISIRSPTGRVLFDRVVGFEPRSSVTPERLAGRAPPRPVSFQASGGARFALTDGLLGLTGRTLPGFEARLAFRPDPHGPARGLFLAVVGGAGQTGSLDATSDPASDRRRAVGSVGGGVGWRLDRPSFSLGLSWEVRFAHATALPGGADACGGSPTCGPRSFAIQGPVLDQSLPIVPGRLALTLTEEFLLALIAPEGQQPWIAPQVGLRAGVELGF